MAWEIGAIEDQGGTPQYVKQLLDKDTHVWGMVANSPHPKIYLDHAWIPDVYGRDIQRVDGVVYILGDTDTNWWHYNPATGAMTPYPELPPSTIPVPPDPIPPDPLPVPEPADVVITLRPGNSLKNVKITRRKRDTIPDLLITVNKSTVVRVE